MAHAAACARGSHGRLPGLALLCSAMLFAIVYKSSKAFTTQYARHPRNAYMFFSCEQRQNFVEEGKPARLVAKDIGGAWVKLSAAKKRRYERMAAKDTKRYKRELADGLKPKPRRKSKAKAVRTVEKARKKATPKRPLSAYTVFAKDMWAKGVGDGLSVPEVGAKLGARWKEMSERQKARYKKRAEKDKVRYERELKAVKLA